MTPLSPVGIKPTRTFTLLSGEVHEVSLSLLQATIYPSLIVFQGFYTWSVSLLARLSSSIFLFPQLLENQTKRWRLRRKNMKNLQFVSILQNYSSSFLGLINAATAAHVNESKKCCSGDLLRLRGETARSEALFIPAAPERAKRCSLRPALAFDIAGDKWRTHTHTLTF